jgi:hypothetical protein
MNNYDNPVSNQIAATEAEMAAQAMESDELLNQKVLTFDDALTQTTAELWQKFGDNKTHESGEVVVSELAQGVWQKLLERAEGLKDDPEAIEKALANVMGVDALVVHDAHMSTQALLDMALVFLLAKDRANKKAKSTKLKPDTMTLEVQVDEKQKDKQLKEITETDFFSSLRERAKDLKKDALKSEKVDKIDLGEAVASFDTTIVAALEKYLSSNNKMDDKDKIVMVDCSVISKAAQSHVFEEFGVSTQGQPVINTSEDAIKPQIDMGKVTAEVQDITQSAFFTELAARAKEMRERSKVAKRAENPT